MPFAGGGGGFGGGGAGVQGAQGAAGGAQGSQGVQGSTGAQGHQGTQGAGSQGAQGANGAQGAQGTMGVGAQGAQGSQGPANAHSPIVRSFTFTHATANLATGASLYTPTAGDLLLAGWFSIQTAFDGTTPMGDFGLFSSATHGFRGNSIGAADMTAVDFMTAADWSGVSLDVGNGYAGIHNSPLFPFNSSTPIVPGILLTDAPINVVVSQDGTTTGGDPGSTQGAATLYLVTATSA